MRYSLRTLLVVLTVATMGLFIVHKTMKTKEAQNRAVQQVIAAGGTIRDYHWQADLTGQLSTDRPSVVKPSNDHYVWNSYADGVVAISLYGCDVRDIDLNDLRRLPKLTDVDLRHSTIQDGDIRSLVGCKALRSLNLDMTPITNDALGPLAALRDLRRLSLNETGIDDKGVILLEGLAKIEELSLARTGVTGEGLAVCSQMPRLRLLDLSSCHLQKKAAIPQLLKLNHLEELILYNVNLDLESIATLKKRLTHARVLH